MLPSADEIVRMLVTEHVSIMQLPLSQTNVSSMFLGQCARLSTPRTENACTFIAIIVGHQVLKISTACSE